MATQNMTMGAEATPLHEVENAPRTEEDWLSLVQQTHAYLTPFKYEMERHWHEALLFLANEQWIRFDGQSNRFQRHNLEGWIPTPATNYLSKTYDRLSDIFTAPEWSPLARAATRDQQDVDAAQVASRILRHLQTELNSQDFHLDLAGWLIATGNCIPYAAWNPKADVLVKQPQQDVVSTPQQGPLAQCPACETQQAVELEGQVCPSCGKGLLTPTTGVLRGPDGQPLHDIQVENRLGEDGQPLFDEFHLGQVEEAAVNVFNFHPQPRDQWSKVMYAVEEIPFDLDELVDVFGAQARDVVPESITPDPFQLHRRTSNYFRSAAEEEKSMARAFYFRHRPSQKFPQGAYVITAGDVVLHQGDLDTSDGQLPYELIRYRQMPGQLWGLGPMVDLIPLQKRINAVDSHIIQNRKTMLSPQWLIPQGSGVTFIDGRPGLQVRYNSRNTGGLKPEKMPGVGLPAHVIEERKQTQVDMEDLSGTQEVLQGQAPAGVEAGVALNILQEQAFRRFGPGVKRWTGGLGRHEARKLRLARENWTESRLVRVLGDNIETETFHYKGADIGSTVDVVVEVDRGALISPAAQDQKLIMASDRGWLGDPRRPEVRGKLLERLGIAGFDAEYTLDAKKARRVLEQLKAGEQPPPPTPFDQHPVHFQVLAEFTKTVEYERLPQPQQQAILERVQVHFQQMQQQAQQAMQAAQAAKGTDSATSRQVAESGAFGDQAAAAPAS